MDRLKQLNEIQDLLYQIVNDPLYIAVIDEDKLTEIVSKVEDLTIELDEEYSRNSTNGQLLTEALEQIEKLEDKIYDYKKDNDELNDKLNDQNYEIEKLKDRVSELESDLDSAQNDLMYYNQQ